MCVKPKNKHYEDKYDERVSLDQKSDSSGLVLSTC